MRTNEQGVKRYFGALWSIHLLLIVTMTVVVLVASERVPDVAVIFAVIITTVMAAVIGFLHGISIFVARERDAAEAIKRNGVNPLDVNSLLPCLDTLCNDPECQYEHDNQE